MDIWHRVGRIVRFSNLGTLMFFLLNICLILALFCPNGETFEVAASLVVCYIITALISLSPVGEWTLAALAGAKEIQRKDIKIRLIPLLEIVFEQAKQRTPAMVNSIRLKIIHDQSPNAFAIGRHSICVIAARILELCKERGITPNSLSNISAVPQATIKSILNGESQNPETVTIKKLCDGFEIMLGEFFSTSEFNVLEQGIY